MSSPRKKTFKWTMQHPIVQAARGRAHEEAYARDHGRCFLTDWIPHDCGPVRDYHHPLKTQLLWTNYSTMGYGPQEWGRVLYDPDNSLTLCRYPAHGQVTSRMWVISYEWLETEAPWVIDFAARTQLGHMLERECPPFSGGSAH